MVEVVDVELVPDGPDGGVAAAVVTDHVRVAAVVDQGERAEGGSANLVLGKMGPCIRGL